MYIYIYTHTWTHRVQGLALRVYVWGLGYRVLRAQGLGVGFRVQGPWSWDMLLV